jgi:thiol-disulfide isomerase/thioredoxin
VFVVLEGSVPPSQPSSPRFRLLPTVFLVATVVTAAAACTWWLDARMQAARSIPIGHGPAASFVGHAVPDFELPDVQTGHPIRLSDSLGQRPVFLLFGSFSCPRLFDELPTIRWLHEEYGDEADFRFVYSREAFHENPEFEEYCRLNPDVEGRGRVQAGLEYYQLSFPCVMADQEVDRLYQPYPARLIVLDRKGTAVFDSEPAYNPAGLRLPEATRRLEECLEEDEMVAAE